MKLILGVSDVRPSFIQQADVPIISTKTCRQFNHPSRFYQFVKKDMICGGYKQGGVDACMVSKLEENWYTNMKTKMF